MIVIPSEYKNHDLDDEDQWIEEEEYENPNLIGEILWKKSDLIHRWNELETNHNKRSKIIDTTKAISDYIRLKNYNIRSPKDTMAENILSILNNSNVEFEDNLTSVGDERYSRSENRHMIVKKSIKMIPRNEVLSNLWIALCFTLERTFLRWKD